MIVSSQAPQFGQRCMSRSKRSFSADMPYIGPINRVYEVLAHKRQLTLNMIRWLTKGLGIPVDILISQHQEGVETA